MLSESARATSAAEQRYRVDAPNARPRTIKVVALDEDAARLVQQLSMRSWKNAKFLALPNAASVLAPDAASLTDWMRSVAGEAQGLVEDVVGTDMMVLVAKTGDTPSLLSRLARLASARHSRCGHRYSVGQSAARSANPRCNASLHHDVGGRSV